MTARCSRSPRWRSADVWDDAARRGARRAGNTHGLQLVRLPRRHHDHRHGESGDALLCLELVIIDAAAGAVGATAHIARYTRTKKRFGNDIIDLDALTNWRHRRTATWWANSPPRGTSTAIVGGSEQ